VTDSLFTSQTPGITQANDAQGGINTSLTFTLGVPRTNSGARFWGPTTTTGTVTLTLYQLTSDDDVTAAAGTVLAQKVSPAWAGGQWNPLTWDSPVALTTGQAYRISAHNSNGDYVASGGVFFAGGMTNGDITGIQDGADPNPPGLGALRNGAFRYGALATPHGGAAGANFFIDILLATGATVTGSGSAALATGATAAGRGCTLGGGSAALTTTARIASSLSAGYPLVSASTIRRLTTHTASGLEVT